MGWTAYARRRDSALHSLKLFDFSCVLEFNHGFHGLFDRGDLVQTVDVVNVDVG